jgi:hypothetical protein
MAEKKRKGEPRMPQEEDQMVVEEQVEDQLVVEEQVEKGIRALNEGSCCWRLYSRPQFRGRQQYINRKSACH